MTKPWKVKRSIRRLLHLREPYKTQRDTPLTNLKVGSIRWFLFDRFCEVRWAGGMAHGQLAHYSLTSWTHAFTITFPKVWQAQRRLTVRRYRDCNCTHRFWRVKALSSYRGCVRHDFLAQMLEHIKEREHQENIIRQKSI